MLISNHNHFMSTATPFFPTAYTVFFSLCFVASSIPTYNSLWNFNEMQKYNIKNIQKINFSLHFSLYSPSSYNNNNNKLFPFEGVSFFYLKIEYEFKKKVYKYIFKLAHYDKCRKKRRRKIRLRLQHKKNMLYFCENSMETRVIEFFFILCV